jgi:hypothetical protein
MAPLRKQMPPATLNKGLTDATVNNKDKSNSRPPSGMTTKKQRQEQGQRQEEGQRQRQNAGVSLLRYSR